VLGRTQARVARRVSPMLQCVHSGTEYGLASKGLRGPQPFDLQQTLLSSALLAACPDATTEFSVQFRRRTGLEGILCRVHAIYVHGPDHPGDRGRGAHVHSASVATPFRFSCDTGWSWHRPSARACAARRVEALLTPPPVRYTLYTVEFEFDPEKSRSNRLKHGIDFDAAQALWDDPDLVEIPARTTDEPRSFVAGRIGARHWSAVVTPRGEKIRIISVRRSRPEEVQLYEGP
jgi:uncharacterized DUF497 family protein